MSSNVFHWHNYSNDLDILDIFYFYDQRSIQSGITNISLYYHIWSNSLKCICDIIGYINSILVNKPNTDLLYSPSNHLHLVHKHFMRLNDSQSHKFNTEHYLTQAYNLHIYQIKTNIIHIYHPINNYWVDKSHIYQAMFGINN